MSVPSQAIRTLMEIGVSSAGSGMFRQALAIFDGIEAVRPDSEGPAIGVALVHMTTRDHDAAIKVLREEALPKNPESAETRMLLGVALKLAGRAAECETVIKELMASSDPKAKSFAQSLQAR